MRAIPLVLMLTTAAGVLAAEPFGPTEAEKAMLPPYCGGPGGKGVDWALTLGKERGWNNHTCYGINRINRYYRAKSANEKKFHLQGALKDFEYSVDHLSKKFPLMPEILYYRGLAYKLQGNPSKAMADWLESIRLDKGYVNSIVELADLYAGQMKKTEQALQLVTEGLMDNPESKALKNRYTRYGGKLPYPSPRTPVEAVPADTAKATAEPEADAVKKTVPAEIPRQSEAVAPVIGTDGNPWCRFCPEPAPSKDPAPSNP